MTRVRAPGVFVRVWETNQPGTWAKNAIPNEALVVVLESDGSMTRVLYTGGIGWVYTECVVTDEEENDERQKKEG